MSSDAPKGIFASIQSLVERVVTLLHGRAELFTSEIEEELSRALRVLLWSLVAVFTAIIGTTFLAVMALLFIPPPYRGWAAMAIAVLFLATAVFGAVSIRRIARAKPRPFDASLRELEKDREHLRSRR